MNESELMLFDNFLSDNNYDSDGLKHDLTQTHSESNIYEYIANDKKFEDIKKFIGLYYIYILYNLHIFAKKKK